MRSHYISPQYGKVETRFATLSTLDHRAKRHHTGIKHRLDEIRIDPLVRQPRANGLSRVKRKGSFLQDNLATEHSPHDAATAGRMQEVQNCRSERARQSARLRICAPLHCAPLSLASC